jgi:tetratricopeptide (TPR) repeat protein
VVACARASRPSQTCRKVLPSRLHEAADSAQQNRHEDAIRDYRALLSRTPEDAEAYFNLGNQYRYVGDYGSAIAAYKAAIRADPELVRAYNNLGNALSAVGDHRNAVIVLKRAVALEPSYPRGYNSLGIAYDGMGEHSRAVLTFKEAEARSHLRRRPCEPRQRAREPEALGRRRRFL